jgi:hypothetical protein
VKESGTVTNSLKAAQPGLTGLGMLAGEEIGVPNQVGWGLDGMKLIESG